MSKHARHGMAAQQYNHDTRYKVYNFLVDFITQNGYAPSIREICDGVRLKSTSSVYSHLMALEREGKIEMKNRSPRAIKLSGFEFVKKNGGLIAYES